MHIAPVQQQSWAHGLQLLYISRQPIWAQNLIRNKLCVSSKFDSTFNGGPSCYKCSKSCCLTLSLVLCLFLYIFLLTLSRSPPVTRKSLLSFHRQNPLPGETLSFVNFILFCSMIDLVVFLPGLLRPILWHSKEEGLTIFQLRISKVNSEIRIYPLLCL